MVDSEADPNRQKRRAEQFLSDAYELDDLNSSNRFYSQWAEEYDEQMLAGLNYLSPSTLARLLHTERSRLRPENPAAFESSVLDVGCGTGLVAAAVVAAATAATDFSSIDGLDYSQSMLDVASRSGYYRRLMQADLNLPLSIDDDSYDALICAGTFTHGHVGAAPLVELARILKPSGLLACTVHFAMWFDAGFEKQFDQLEQDNILKCITREPGQYFEGEQDEGWFCVFQKCTTD